SDDVREGFRRAEPPLEVEKLAHLEQAVEFASGLLADFCRLLEGELRGVLEDAARRIGRPLPDWESLTGLFVPVRAARGLRPRLSQEEYEQLERSRDQGDHRGINQLEEKRLDLRGEEAQKQLPRSRPVVEWEQVRERLARAVVLGDPGYGKTMLLWHE